MRFDGMSQGLVGPNAVVVLPANPLAFNNATGFQIGDDPLDGSLRYAHLHRDFAEHQ